MHLDGIYLDFGMFDNYALDTAESNRSASRHRRVRVSES